MAGIELQNEKQYSTLSQRARAFSVDALLGHQKIENSSGRDVQSRVPVKDVIRNDIKVELVNCSLWLQFHRLENEMIITKAGRRIFPSLKFDVFNLNPDAYYLLWMDIVPVDRHRYRYAFPNSRWTIAGKCETHSDCNLYIHPDGVAQGSHWMSQSVAFDKVKLTNNKECKQKGQIVLNSMHKYQPRLHIQLVDIRNRQNAAPDAKTSRRFEFIETSFIAVTAYQNQQITTLKIRSNPFAKGFRDAIKIRNVHLSCPDTKNEVSFHHPTVNTFPSENVLGMTSIPNDTLQCIQYPHYVTLCRFCNYYDISAGTERYLTSPHLSHACRMYMPCK
ncbi:T-box transcription factor TBX20-like [Centruroides vittatus]|uniref:T-box transcription factor TBX20-like n=1 Tax=Centruroides vittatus TaxID=120091 RepID=UPI0035101CA9